MDHRVQCEVEDPDKVETLDADAFRSFPDGGDEFILDFIRSQSEECEVVVRLRVHRDVLRSIHDRLTGSVDEPEMVLFSAPLRV